MLLTKLFCQPKKPSKIDLLSNYRVHILLYYKEGHQSRPTSKSQHLCLKESTPR